MEFDEKSFQYYSSKKFCVVADAHTVLMYL